MTWFSSACVCMHVSFMLCHVVAWLVSFHVFHVLKRDFNGVFSCFVDGASEMEADIHRGVQLSCAKAIH